MKGFSQRFKRINFNWNTEERRRDHDSLYDSWMIADGPVVDKSTLSSRLVFPRKTKTLWHWFRFLATHTKSRSRYLHCRCRVTTTLCANAPRAIWIHVAEYTQSLWASHLNAKGSFYTRRKFPIWNIWMMRKGKQIRRSIVDRTHWKPSKLNCNSRIQQNHHF